MQPQVSFGALRTGRVERSGTGDELLHIRGDEFLLKTADRGLRVKPDGTYNFVRVQGATRNQMQTVVSAHNSHAGLADGKPVLYAGTVRFSVGQLDWWSNYSGTYQPVAAFRQQAQLPDERFVPWQKLQMGGIGLNRGMLSDHRTAASPPGPARPAQSTTMSKETSAASTATKSASAPVSRRDTANKGR